jgi:arylformamidase
MSVAVRAIDLENEYNNRARVPTHATVIDGWAEDAARYRAEAGARFATLPYGQGPRQVLDLIHPTAAAPGARPVLFIHGGYWQALDRRYFTHLAKGPNAHGITVAVAGYDLCPDVSVSAIIGQMQTALQALARHAGRPAVVAGHSAGGHLAACLLATDWSAFSHGRARPVSAALAISGLFELDVLVPTSVNLKLGMDQEEARHASPRLWAPPADAPSLSFDAWVGAEESSEYLRQSRSIVSAWTAAGMTARYAEIPEANHFTVIAGLMEPDSSLTRRLVEHAGAA